MELSLWDSTSSSLSFPGLSYYSQKAFIVHTLVPSIWPGQAALLLVA